MPDAPLPCCTKTDCSPFDPDAAERSVAALRLDVDQNAAEIPEHRHGKGQLVFAARGAVTCKAGADIWIVPPGSGIWIPGGVAHSNDATANAMLMFLFVAPERAILSRRCCTLALSPMVREMVQHLADHSVSGLGSDAHRHQLEDVLLGELAGLREEPLRLPGSDHPKLRAMMDALRNAPADRSRLDEWAQRLALSERSLRRLVVQETGLTFGQWRQQLHLLLAIRALAGGESVQRVSGMLGYASVTAFITMFKKASGTTPSRYVAQR